MRREVAPLSVVLAQQGPIPLDVALSCGPGELLALVGPSGSGKTTVLRAIAGLYRPASGRISADGDTWFDSDTGLWVSPQVRAVGLVFQDYALFPHLSALGNVRLAMLRLPEPERSRQAAALLARVHLDGLEARTPDKLSGGQRQRVALARALARDPKVLLLDEPFSAVDRMTRERLKEELAGLRRSLEVPILLVTHDLEEAQALADRICVIHAGTTLQSGTPDDVRLRPNSPLVARLMGHTNVFEGTIVQASAGSGEGRIRWGERVLRVATTGGFRDGDRVAWLIPSGYIALVDAGADDGVAKGTLIEVTPLGEMTALGVRVGPDPHTLLRFKLATRDIAARALAPDSPVGVHLHPEGIHLMLPVS